MGTLPKRRADETRRSIVRAAEAVFGEKGYDGATVDNIISVAGISRGAFYHHFSNKKEVFRGLLQAHLDGEFDLSNLTASSASLHELIQRLVDIQVEHLNKEHESGALSLEFWSYAAREEWAREVVASFHRSVRERVAASLRAAQRSGRVRGEIDADESALLIIAVFEGVAVMKALDPSGVDVPQLTAPWADLIERFVSAGYGERGGVGGA